MDLGLRLVCAILLVLTILYYGRHQKHRGRRLPPGPTPLPLIGNILDMGGVLHHTLARLARRHGPVMTLKQGLTTTVVVVSSSDMAREALTKEDRRLAARPIRDATRALGWSDRSVGWLPSSDPLWRTFRRVMATHIFSPRSLQDTHGLRERTVRDLVSYLRGRSGQEVAVGRVLLSSTLNLTSNILFSADTVDMEGRSPERLLETLDEAIDPLMWKPNVSDIFPLLAPLDLQGRRRMAAAQLRKLFSFLEGVVDRRLAEAAAAASGSKVDRHNSDFLDVLLDLMSTGEMARGDAVALMFDILIAGGDPMATTVEWALAELLHNPTAMSKVRAEMAEASFGCSGEQAIEEGDLMRLPYLQAVVKETQRLHPVSPLTLPHKATEDGVVIGGYVIPKGSTVIVNLSAVMRDPDVWERPEEFVPERFIGGDGKVDMKGRKEQFEYIPFGGGRRQCPGMALSERVVPLVLASLLQAFEWHLPDGMTSDEMDMNEMFVSANIRAVPLKAVPVAIM
jgi:cytochrome P450